MKFLNNEEKLIEDLIKFFNNFDLYFEKSDDSRVFDKNIDLIRVITEKYNDVSFTNFCENVYPKLNLNGRKTIEWYFSNLIPNQYINVETIIGIIEKIYEISYESFRQSSQQDIFVIPRYTAMWALKNYTNMNEKEIGNLFCGRKNSIKNKDLIINYSKSKDRTSVINGLKIYNNIIKENMLKEVIRKHETIKKILDEEITKERGCRKFF